MQFPLSESFGEMDDAFEDGAVEDDNLCRSDADDYTPEAFDQYLTAEIVTDRGGDVLRGTVKSRKRNHDGKPIGSSNPNPLLDTRENLVCFEDGTEDAYTANLIAESLYSQIDDDGRRLQTMEEIVDHERNHSALKEEDAYYSTKSGPKPKRTTKGWCLLVEWKDGSSLWVPQTDLKDTCPVQVADYAVTNNVTAEPAFCRWVPFVLKKRERILKKVKTKYWSTLHKYGLELAKSVNHALEIDRRTETDFWRRAIEKEIRNVFPAFDMMDDDSAVPPGYEFVETYFVFDTKMDLTRKARLVARGNMTEATEEQTFASVVSRDTIRLFFLLAALNDMDLLSCDVQNAYLAAPNKEKVWTKFTDQLGPEYNGRRAIISKAFYGLLSSSGRSFRDYLAMNLRELGFIPLKTKPDLWM